MRGIRRGTHRQRREATVGGLHEQPLAGGRLGFNRIRSAPSQRSQNLKGPGNLWNPDSGLDHSQQGPMGPTKSSTGGLGNLVNLDRCKSIYFFGSKVGSHVRFAEWGDPTFELLRLKLPHTRQTQPTHQAPGI